MPATTFPEPCPKCGSAMWDNRVDKRNPRAPDAKCKDKGCDGVVWPEKNGNGHAPARVASARPQTVPPSQTAYGVLPGDGEEEAALRKVLAPQAPVAVVTPMVEYSGAVVSLYEAVFVRLAKFHGVPGPSLDALADVACRLAITEYLHAEKSKVGGGR